MYLHVCLSIEVRPRNHYCCWKAESVKYSKFVFVEHFMPHSKHLHRIIFLSVTCLPLPYILLNSLNGRLIENICVENVLLDFLYKVSLKHFPIQK